MKLIAAMVLWSVAVFAGMLAIREYETTPGKPAQVRTDWPAAIALKADATRPTLIMLAHPQCPCTRASMAQLARLLTQVPDKIDAHVLFVIPQGVATGEAAAKAEWHDTELVRAARQIPGVTVEFDEGGDEAHKLGATTSGHVFLYTPEGKLAFQGGITDSRGHEGDNAGEDAIVDIVNGRTPEVIKTDVFGCGL